MKKKDNEIDKIEEKTTEPGDKKSKKLGLSSVFKKKANDETETEDITQANDDDEPKKVKQKTQIPFKQILIVLGISLAASVLLIFIFDWTGWRTSLRDDLTTKLLGQEKTILITRLEFEYAQKLKAAQNDILKEERATLVLEYEELEAQKADFETRMSRLETNEKKLEEEKKDLTEREDELLIRINQFENGVLEVNELSKIYQAMEPKNAAKILSSMRDDNLVVKILKAMKTDSVAAILELMETQKAADILSKLN